MILFSNPKAQYLSHKTAIDAAIANVLDSGWYILGKQMEGFEDEFASYVGTDHGVGVASGTDAITLALRGLSIGTGDDVIAPSHTAVATVAGIEQSGAKAVCADIEAGLYTIDAAHAERLITPQTKAIVAVHLYGQPVDMDAIMDVAKRHGLKVIEDCAQATGAKYKGMRVGSIGDAGCFSFFPTKNLGGFGDGGMVTTNDAGLAEQVRQLRLYGWADDRVSHQPGANSRLDELQAAVLRVKLPHLDDDNAKRRAIADRYDAAFADTGLELPVRRDDVDHVFHLYVIATDRRDEMMNFLKSNDVGAAIHYAEAVHQQPAYEDRVTNQPLIETEATVAKILTLPIYPELTEEDQGAVISAVLEFV
ncbi:MAG: DegT/DnrJ/EryC1/StrS family aminotransferase [Rhodospirillaceae bacterium]|nr:DegT/DnrJ/EryC1/StrS family aminotransferase [Rhodospirillaceae bacterium]MBT4219299.1 DegT/DnrJ/EryC1/StrS family aminotransferase [Rhodospirillaceae bacterium]MBT4464423.1 DegT/DnrJ/EryC1/StrS family aminotransferase [Rhodospirillaceae bacterium]MBT5013158.1 DegT/DnrJ/EryC1/StrS family aminotransferase [Rhodospirillaceae bacterium]MBT5309504.1 DegT/DnrJ/EryC1/StrS family aminotransferase [Rhodospirillaceae bacterium]